MVYIPGDGMESSRSFARFDARTTGGGMGMLEPMVGRDYCRAEPSSLSSFGRSTSHYSMLVPLLYP